MSIRLLKEMLQEFTVEAKQLTVDLVSISKAPCFITKGKGRKKGRKKSKREGKKEKKRRKEG